MIGSETDFESDTVAVLAALPRLARLTGETIVVKVGGSVRGEGTVMEDVALLQRVGINPVIVHGGGPQISSMLTRLGVETRFVQGRRYTDEATMEVVHMVLMRLNGQFVSFLNGEGIPAIGLNGLDARLLQARIRDESLGLVGEVDVVNEDFLNDLIDQGFVPVIAPLAVGPASQPLNVNADTVAGEVARALAAEMLVLFTDVPGVLDSNGTVVPQLSRAEVDRLIQDDVIRGGMIPKIEACLRALDTVPRVQVLDGRSPHALIRALLTDRGLGTTLVAEAN